MWQPPRNPINGPRAPWKDSLSLPGAGQMKHGVRLVKSRPFEDREPAGWWAVTWPHPSGPDTIRTCRGKDGSWAFIYVPNCQKVKVHANTIKADKIAVSYYNPRTGETVAGDVVEGGKEHQFQPPFDPEGRDWVIILDDPAKGYLKP
jgi:hypothetical protein